MTTNANPRTPLHEKLLVQLATETAAELERACARAGLTNATELHHLAPACKRATERLGPTWDPAAALGPYGFGDTLGWHGVGNVDVVFSCPDGDRTFVELKCGSGTDSLAACVWDAVKLGAGVLAGNAGSGYMLAGAPVASWERPVLGAALFESRRWSTDGHEIRGDYLSWWRFWQNETTPHIPGRVPAALRTTELGAFPLQIAGSKWELRLARVEPGADEWLDWQPIP